MSDKRKINDDELTKLIKESLSVPENKMPVVTKELMDETLTYIRRNENANQKEVKPEKKYSSYKYRAVGAFVCAACLFLIAGAVFLNHIKITKPGTGDNFEMAMDTSQESDSISEPEEPDSDGLHYFYDKSKFDDYTSGAIEEIQEDDSIADSEDEELPVKNEESDNVSKNDATDSSKSDNFSKNDRFEILGNGRISGSDIAFPENILGCSVKNLYSATTKSANGGTKTIGKNDIKEFCRLLENELSSKKDEFNITGIAFYSLPNDWKKKILIHSKDSSGEDEFHYIFVYEKSFAVCSVLEAETNPGSMCRMYE